MPQGSRLNRQGDKAMFFEVHCATSARRGPIIAFLNAQHDQLKDQPLRLAVESDERLTRVEAILEEMTLKA